MEENIKKIETLINSTQKQYRHAGVMIWYVEQGLRAGSSGFLAAGFGINGQVCGPGEYQPTAEKAVEELVPYVERYVDRCNGIFA